MKPLCRKVCFGLRLALFALTVPLALAALLLIWQDYNARRDAIITQVELKAAHVNAQLEDFVHRIDAATGVYAASWVSSYGPEASDSRELATKNSSLLALADDRPEFSAASITDASGVVMAASDSLIIGTRIGDEALFERAITTGKFIASDVFVQEVGETPPYAQFLQPLVWDGGPIQAFLVTKSDLSTISGSLDMSVGFPESAKSGRLELTVVDVGAGEASRTIVKEFEAGSPNHVFNVDIPAATAMVKADSVRLNQIL